MGKRRMECKLALLIAATAVEATAQPIMIFVRDYAGVSQKALQRGEAEAFSL